MAKGYRPVARDQQFLLPPDMREWLPADHPVWLVISAVADHLDTSAFHAARRLGGAGAAGFDPDMLVMLLTWAYANRVTSSRRIEALCRTDVAFRVICGGDVPDHVTGAPVRAGFGDAVCALFSQVLVLCAELGMGRLGGVALDGPKVAASAAEAADRAGGGGRERAAAGGAGRGEEDAGGIKRGPGGRKPFPPDAHFQVARARQAVAAAAARQARRERKQAAAKGPGPVRNITDPDSRLMKTRAGFIQGYNAQNVTSEDGLIIATELTDDPADMAWFEPMMGQAEEAARLITGHRPPPASGGQGHPAEPGPGGGDGRNGGTGGSSGENAAADLIGLALTDAGYCSEQNPTRARPDRLIPPRRPRPPPKTPPRPR